METSLLFSRYRDGARPVRVVEGGWEVLKDGAPTTFTTVRGLLAELTGHPAGRNWSLDRYFGLGRYAPEPPGQADVLDLFDPIEPPAKTSRPILLLEPLAPPVLGFRSGQLSDPSITVPSEQTRKKTSPLVVSGPVGVDLEKRGHEVRKLLFAGFGRKIFSAGYDPEDVLQEVYKGLLARNRGKCPWDPSKSSFGHYVHMVCGCVLSNYHRKQKRVRQFEQSGLGQYKDGQYQVQDAANNTTIPAGPSTEHESYLFGEAADDLVDYILGMSTHKDAKLAITIMPYVVSGSATRKEMAAKLGVSQAAVSRAVSFLRQAALSWRKNH